MGRKRLAEGLLALIVHTGNQPLQSLLGCADGPHGVVDPAWSQTALDDFESAAFAENHA